jgi:hypothetical protein
MRAGILILMSLGFVVTGTSIARLLLVANGTGYLDPFYNWKTLGILTYVELSLTIIAACLPVLNGPIQQLLLRMGLISESPSRPLRGGRTSITASSMTGSRRDTNWSFSWLKRGSRSSSGKSESETATAAGKECGKMARTCGWKGKKGKDVDVERGETENTEKQTSRNNSQFTTRSFLDSAQFPRDLGVIEDPNEAPEVVETDYRNDGEI